METLNSVLQVLQLNHTFFIYVCIFLLFLFLVSKFLLSPVYEKFLVRENLTKGQILRAEDIEKETQTLQEEYEKVLLEYNQKFRQALQEKKNETLQNQQVQIEQAHEQAQNLILKARQDFQHDFIKAKKQLDQEAPQLAQSLLSKFNQ